VSGATGLARFERESSRKTPRRNTEGIGRARAVLVAILRDLTLDELRAEGFGEDQIVDLSAAGAST
jgi:hypothetical protein